LLLPQTVTSWCFDRDQFIRGKRVLHADSRQVTENVGARDARQTRTVDANRPKKHWDRVRQIFGRETGRDGLDTATRYLTSGPADRR
jgi:hypothetical protein